MKKLFGGKKSKAIKNTTPLRIGDSSSREFEPSRHSIQEPRHSIQEPRRSSQLQEPRRSFQEPSHRRGSHHFEAYFNTEEWDYLNQPIESLHHTESDPNINQQNYNQPQAPEHYRPSHHTIEEEK